MTEPTKSQRGKMAAHLTDLVGTAARNIDAHDIAITNAADCIAAVLRYGTPEMDYRLGLKLCNVDPADIDAAVASIMRDEHPAGSLPARLAERRRIATEGADREMAAHGATAAEGLGRGIAWGCREALEMLGVKP